MKKIESNLINDTMKNIACTMLLLLFCSSHLLGQLISEEINIDGVHQLRVTGFQDVVIDMADKNSVTVTYDTGLKDKVNYKKESGFFSAKVTMPRNVNEHTDLKIFKLKSCIHIFCTTDLLNEIILTEVSSIQFNDFRGKQTNFNINSCGKLYGNIHINEAFILARSSNLELKGKIMKGIYKISASNLDFKNLQCDSLSIKATTSNVSVQVSNYLAIKQLITSTLNYSGKAKVDFDTNIDLQSSSINKRWK